MPPASAIESPLIYEISEGSLSKTKNLETIESEILPNLGETSQSSRAQIWDRFLFLLSTWSFFFPERKWIRTNDTQMSNYIEFLSTFKSRLIYNYIQ